MPDAARTQRLPADPVQRRPDRPGLDKALGLRIPPTLLARADHVVE